MRKLVSILLILSLLASLSAALAEDGETTVIAFPELPFTTLADFDCVARAEGNHELFLYTGKLDTLPCLYICLDDGPDRIADADQYIDDVEIAGIREDYGANGGMQFSRHGDFKLGGRPMANVEMEFTANSGHKVYKVTAAEVRDGYSVIYSALYTDPGLREYLLTALDTLAANLRYTGTGAAAPSGDVVAVPVTCAQQGYTTLADPAWRTEWVDGDGMYFHFTDDNVPYVLAWVDNGEDRITDGAVALENYLPDLQEQYRQNGAVSTTLHGSFTVAGRPVAAADVQYRNSVGMKIYLLVVVDVRESFTATYHVRYLEEAGRQQALDALDLIAANLNLTAPAEAPRVEAPRDRQEPSAEAGVYSLAVSGLRETENGFGRCVAPEDYEVRWGHTCCTTDNSISIPHRLGIIAQCPERGIMMRYISGGDFLCTDDGSTEYDGQFNADFYTPMLHYMDASEYCDYLAVTSFPELADTLKVVSEDPLPEARQAMDRLARAKLAKMQVPDSGLLGVYKIEAGEYSVCKKHYSCEYEGTPNEMVIVTACLPIRISTSYSGLKPEGGKLVYGTIETSSISWEVPFTYILTCPSEFWAEGSTAFDQFVANTRTSDQFNEANQKLAKALWKVVEKSKGLSSGTSYSEQTLREETGNGEDYYDEQVTDYIFDQNDYTLSDGSHVKVSTAYDYVYEGDNGTVYYSNSAFAPTGGGTQLYPN